MNPELKRGEFAPRCSTAPQESSSNEANGGPDFLPIISGWEVLRALARAGFTPVQRAGGLVVLRRDERAVIVRLGRRLVDATELRALLDLAGIAKREFLGLLFH